MLATLLFSALIGHTLATSPSCPPSSNSTTSYPQIPSGKCVDYTITVPITSENLIWAPPPFKNNFDVTNWLFNTSRKDSRDVWVPFAGSENVTKDYTISATFCTPIQTKDGKETTVLLATSGLGYDGRYWAPSYKVEEYSFVEHALKAGYSVFYYDRIGTGRSQK
jgi:pimeloyl-ACP methyl ester carboxylesterase